MAKKFVSLDRLETFLDQIKKLIPTVNNPTITIKQAGASKGSFTLNQSGTTTIELTDNNTTYSAATTSANGLMSSTDKSKLDGIATGATKVTVDSALSSTSTNPVQNKVVNSALAGKAASNHTHSYLPLSGGTVTGKISRSSGGSWISARDNVVVGNTRYGQAAGSSYNPALGSKTTSGHWSIGNLAGDESLVFSYDTDTNYNANTNSATITYLPTTGGTIALKSDITAAVGDIETLLAAI